MRLVIARCSVDYAGRLTAHLPSAPRLILVKADGSVSIHADDRAYKPLNWMSPPCTLKEGDGDEGVWTVVNKAGEKLIITMEEILHDSSHELGVDPGLIKDGVEAHLQELLADRIETLGEGYTPDPPRVPHRHRPGRHPVPGRRRRDRRGGDQAARRDRRRGAAHPLSGAAQPRPASRAGEAASSRPRRSSRRPASWRRTAASAAWCSTTTRCAASRTTSCGCSDAVRSGSRTTRGPGPTTDPALSSSKRASTRSSEPPLRRVPSCRCVVPERARRAGGLVGLRGGRAAGRRRRWSGCPLADGRRSSGSLGRRRRRWASGGRRVGGRRASVGGRRWRRRSAASASATEAFVGESAADRRPARPCRSDRLDGSVASRSASGRPTCRYVPSGPGSVGLPVGVPVPVARRSSSALGLVGAEAVVADALAGGRVDADLVRPAVSSLSEVAPRVTTVPSTAASSAPAPAATRLRRAPPTSRGAGRGRWCDAGADRAAMRRRCVDARLRRPSAAPGRPANRAAGTPPGGDGRLLVPRVRHLLARRRATRRAAAPPERSATSASARRPATVPRLSASAPRSPMDASSSARARSRLPAQSARTPSSWWK